MPYKKKNKNNKNILYNSFEHVLIYIPLIPQLYIPRINKMMLKACLSF